MNLQDRLRQELRGRAEHIPVGGAGARAVIAGARARTRRTRAIGAAVALALVAGVGGVAISMRGGSTDSLATTQVESTHDSSSSEAGTREPADPAGTGDDSLPAPSPQATSAEGGNDEVATTELTPSSANENDESEPAAATADAAEDDVTTDPSHAQAASSTPETLLQVAHRGGFVALHSGSTLTFSTDLTNWNPIPDPRPGPSASITRLVSNDGALYVAGLSANGATSQPWVAKSSDLSAWEYPSIPAAADDGSPLTQVLNTLYSFDVDDTGMVITGETLVVVDVAQLVSAEVFASESWSLGDSQGDLSKIVVYDVETGSPTHEIDLIAEGVPQTTLELLASPDPVPFVMIADGSGDLITVDTDLQPGTVISGAFIAGDRFIGSGFSSRFAGRVLWSSPDGRTWSELAVSVVEHNSARLAGEVDGRIVAFTGQGPILTVIAGDPEEWTEVRLDRLFGNRNDEFQIIDAAFAANGAIAVVATVDEAQGRNFHVLVSSDGLSWDVRPLSEIVPPGRVVTAIDSVAFGSSAVVSYRAADNSHHSLSLPVD